MCDNQCRNIHIFNVPYYDRTSIFSALSQRSNAVSVIIRIYAKSYQGLAVIQRSARFCMCRVGNNPMVRQKKHDMGKTAPYNAGGIFVCGNGHSFLQCFCLSHKIFFGIKRSCLLSCVFGYFFKTGRNQQAIIFRLSLHNCFSEAAQTSKQKQGSSRRIVLFAVFIIALQKSPWYVYFLFSVLHIFIRCGIIIEVCTANGAAAHCTRLYHVV